MLIDKGKLIALMKEKTGQSRQDVEEQLARLALDIRTVADAGETFTIPGLGTFSGEDGKLQFEPTEQLKTEINQKYAGMKPIELMAAFKETGAGVPVEETPAEEPVPPAPSVEKKPQKPVAAESDEAKEKSDQPEVTAGNEQAEEEPVAASETPEDETGGKNSDKETQTKKQPAAVSAKEETENDPIGKFLIAAVVVIGILVAGWFLYDSGILSESGTTDNSGGLAADTATQNREQSAALLASADSTAQVTGADSTEQNTGNNVSQNRAGEQSEAPAVYGLKGEPSAEGNNGYTIVIHSMRSRSPVQGIADSLGQEGYRTVLDDVSSRGKIWWRLGLGQFETIADAQEAAQTLSDAYKENHFIKRIQ